MFVRAVSRVWYMSPLKGLRGVRACCFSSIAYVSSERLALCLCLPLSSIVHVSSERHVLCLCVPFLKYSTYLLCCDLCCVCAHHFSRAKKLMLFVNLFISDTSSSSNNQRPAIGPVPRFRHFRPKIQGDEPAEEL